MAKRPALGRGMGALLGPAASTAEKKYFHCPLEDLRPHVDQPRKSFNDAKMEELVASIREKGIIQPLVVRRQDDHYQIIAGERRWRAAQKAGLSEVPVVIQDVSEDWALEMALIENIQREDLNPIEEAEAYRNLVSNFDLTQEEVARRVGKDRSSVANALRLLKLPEVVRRDLLESRLSMGHARALLALESDEDIVEASSELQRKGLSVRDVEALVKRIKNFGANRQRRPAKVEPDPQLDLLAKELTRVLDTPVRIAAQGKKGGRIEISYASAEELERLSAHLGIT
ncbi:chromosome partitioning protein, ParB family [Geoalkalibacter ferrihydriticus]|uniref:Plasmid stablization protein ParB n=2 Tax=Geoalkalibacter ferrihydriticus TaxID=392333 RepID=A0A0C2HY63_9BACT|nr:ParB/RepB/Spo0J family partition protein [Geoalkalibacter ferrihydriticus]KIH77667.1 plasmid stablization protein ParB [Geoalkalibacter ferrihydriticus DSM 17813]SDL72829.1 chromosome partitioning protein, ParB family [Geoalkalibacter ferrihydriticus]